MNEIGNKIRDARIGMNLSIKDLSDKTKIRPYVIESIEKGDFSVMDEVYVNSFIKTLCSALKINFQEVNVVKKTSKQKAKKFDDELIEKTQITQEKKSEPKISNLKGEFKKVRESTNENFKDLFKAKNINKERRYQILNYSIYTVLFLAISGAIYFGFKSLDDSTPRIDNSDITNASDTVSLEQESNSIFSYFEKPDSLRLHAKAHDTVWIRVLSDGTNINESLLKPGMEEFWSAKDFFVVDMGNVGGADIFRNNEKLPIFGRKGSVVKNVKITATEVSNIYTQLSDSARTARRKAKEEQNEEPKLIQQSTIQQSTPIFQNKRDSLKL